MPAMKVGTDCSGMEAPIMALKNLRIPISHEFSCDVNKFAQATIEANFPPKKFYDDLMARDNSKAAGCDFYMAGFPCQPFSTAGLQQGFKDEKGRGKVFFGVLDYIATKKPKVFVLENVSGLVKQKQGEYFKAILKALNDLGKYNVSWEVLDTKEHGVPHSRRRVYIVGIRRDVDDGSFAFPEPIDCPSIERFLDRRRGETARSGLPPKSSKTAHGNVKSWLRQLKKDGGDPLKNAFIVDCDSSDYRSKATEGVSPCITCSRGAGHWVTNRGRRLNKMEMMRLQGMDPTTFKVAVSPSQLGKQLGNTMSVNVVERLLVRLLPAAGLSAKNLPDRWRSGAALAKLEKTRNCSFAKAEIPSSVPCRKRPRADEA